jgi:hypothetical protein
MKPIPNFTGYFADENSNIFSMKPHGGNCGKGAKPPSEPRRLKPTKDTGGYFLVRLYRDGKQFNRKVARLMLETFVGPRPEGMEACHNNGIRTDDRCENLRWDTPKNNHADKKLHGTLANGEKNGLSKLNETQVRVIRRCCELGMAQRETAKIFGVCQPTIGSIVRRETWKHIY